MSERRQPGTGWRASGTTSRGGGAALIIGCAVAIAAVVVAFKLLSYSTFDILAKIVVLAAGATGALVVLFEDPFHEDLGDEARFGLRLKLQGKLMVITTLTAMTSTSLNLCTDYMSKRDEKEALDERIKIAANETLDRFAALSKSVSSLHDKTEKLNSSIDGIMISKLNTLATAEAIAKLATAESVSRLATADAVKKLATSEAVGKLATAEVVGKLATAEALGKLPTTDAIGKLATAEASASSHHRSRRQARHRRSLGKLAEAVDKLPTAETINKLTELVNKLGPPDSKADDNKCECGCDRGRAQDQRVYD